MTPLKHVEFLVGRLVSAGHPDDFSTGEQIAIGLLYSRLDWLPEGYSTDLLAAVDRIGLEWFAALREARRFRWYADGLIVAEHLRPFVDSKGLELALGRTKESGNETGQHRPPCAFCGHIESHQPDCTWLAP